MSGVARGRPSALAVIEAGTALPVAGGRRHRLDGDAWALLAQRLEHDPLEAASLWCDGTAVHALFLRGEGDGVIASVEVEAGRYLGLSEVRPAMSAHERMARDLWGVEAMSARDLRPLLDHGTWSCTFPLAVRPGPATYPPEPPEFPLWPEEEGRSATQLGLGPVGAPVDGPAHLRLVLDGDRVARVDPWLGFAHRGVVRAMRGLRPGEAVALASRVDAAASVAYQVATADALEQLAGAAVPPRGRALRGFAGALEAATGELRALARLMRAVERFGVAERLDTPRRALAEAVEACFGHRLMFDAVVPGGMRPLRGESRVVGLEPLLEAADVALGAEWREVLRSCDRAAEGAGADAVRVQVLERLDGARRALRSARDGVLAVSTSGELAAPVAAVPDGEGFGAAPSFRGMLHCWIRMRAGVVDCVHWQDPAVARLHGVLERGRGMRMDRFELLCRAARVSVPGIDQ